MIAFTWQVSAQQSDSITNKGFSTDTVHISPTLSEVKTTAVEELIKEKNTFVPNPTKAVIYSAICPGLGQIYNRKYWKLPIIYGGFIGCTYAISFNSRYYNDYKDAYKDYVEKSGDSWMDFVPYQYRQDPTKMDSTWFVGVLKRKKDYYRRYRDLSYIITAGLYVLCMIDAYVDAQLFDFDISPDLSLRVEPAIFEPTRYNRRSFGLLLSFNF